nr:immunoglobulin light chain junction region [Macaca mulatta]MOX30856.1 immunoglobulin light chain junction region [Macaca mulatta]
DHYCQVWDGSSEHPHLLF